MTIDIARLDHNAIAVIGNTNDALARLAQWVEAARNAHALVAPLVDTAFVPDAYRPKVDPRATPEQKKAAFDVAVANATAAVLQGLSLGIDPLVALQQIYLIHGRPGMYTKMKVALVTSRGHEVWTEDLSDTRAVVCGRRKGTDYVERVTVTMDMARKAKWTSNAKYQETPQDMLFARAAGRVCDRIASDVLMGIPSVEEIEDTIQVEATAGAATRTVNPPRRRAPEPQRAALPAVAAAAPEPPLDDEPQAAPAPAQDAPAASGEKMLTQTQSRKLQALLKDTGRATASEALAHINFLIGHDIGHTKELTAAEADAVIEELLTEKNAQNEAAPADPEPALDGELWPDTPAIPGGGE